MLPAFKETHGSSTDLGGRPSQHDCVFVKENIKLSDGYTCNIYGVFDGHGSDGSKVSNFIKKELEAAFVSVAKSFISDPSVALKNMYQLLSEQLKENQAIDTYMSGSTAVVVVSYQNTLYVANIGDSRAVLVQLGESGNWKGIPLTTDHNCMDKEELQRVQSAGARVEQLLIDGEKDGPLRIFKGTLPYPGLVVTRAFGDAVASRLGVLSVPEITTWNLTSNDKCLILATDGVWDGITIPEAVSIISSKKDPKSASKAVTAASKEGMNRQSIDDNTTNIVVFFDK